MEKLLQALIGDSMYQSEHVQYIILPLMLISMNSSYHCNCIRAPTSDSVAEGGKSKPRGYAGLPLRE